MRARPDGFLPIDVLCEREFGLAAATGFTLFAGYLIMVFAAPLLIDDGRHLSSITVGLVLLPARLVSVAVSRAAGTVVRRTGPWPLATALAIASTCGLLLAAAAGRTPVAVVASLAACVAGFSAGQVTLMAALPGIVTASRQGVATGLFQLVFITGGSIGAAGVGALVAVLDLRTALALLAPLPAAGVVLARLGRRSRRRRR
ncbi:MAG TPA: MFS transporter [Actinocrinis sp.]